MRVDIKIPSAGESVTEMRISQWLKPDGARVEREEAVLELETDKANMELAADEGGTLHVTKPAGESVRVGDVVGYVETEATAARPAEKPTPPAERTAPTIPPAPAASEERRIEVPGTAEPADSLSPAIRRLAREHSVDLHEVSGTGRKGRVRKEDVLDYVKARGSAPPADAAPPDSQPLPETPPPSLKPAPAAIKPGERERIVPMSLLRKKIAERLVRAQQTAAILTTFNEIDMTAVQDLRAKYKESFKQKHGVGLGIMSFFVKASIEALKQIPQLNAIIDGDNIVYRNYYNIGVAVSTDRGLLVPVLRDADTMGFADIERKIADFAAKAREGKISIDDLSGGTFSITNGGVFGSLLSTPILNPPESGILGMHNIQKRAMVIEDRIQIRPMMYVALSYDHRIVDGREAVTFLVRIKEGLEDPQRLLLAV